MLVRSLETQSTQMPSNCTWKLYHPESDQECNHLFRPHILLFLYCVGLIKCCNMHELWFYVSVWPITLPIRSAVYYSHNYITLQNSIFTFNKVSLSIYHNCFV